MRVYKTRVLAACYLIAQNRDSQKEPIAFAQSYFALQTRKQELIQERLLLQARLDARDRLRASGRELSQGADIGPGDIESTRVKEVRRCRGLLFHG